MAAIESDAEMLCGTPDEDYIAWIIRATYNAEQTRKSANLKSWVEAFLTKKWSWGGHMAKIDDVWQTLRMLRWRDDAWWQGKESKAEQTISRDGRPEW